MELLLRARDDLGRDLTEGLVETSPRVCDVPDRPAGVRGQVEEALRGAFSYKPRGDPV
jgi:hypothetical protein